MRRVILDNEDKKYIQKQFLIYSLGIVNGIQYKIIDSKKESSLLLFRPDVIVWLVKNNFSQEFIDIMNKGYKIGQVANEAPDYFSTYINELAQLILLELSKLQGIEIIKTFGVDIMDIISNESLLSNIK